jgi:hypothetical protein
VTQLIDDALSEDPWRRPCFGAIMARLEANDFAIADGIDSAKVSVFVRIVEAAEP